MISRQELGINGEHTALGNALSMAEFKGKTIQALTDIEKRLDKMETNCKDCKIEYDKRLDSLEQFKTWVIAIAFALGGIGSLAWDVLKGFLFK